MALKSKEWFYKRCLQEVKQFSRLSHLCWHILEKGIGQSDSTRGHVTQAIGACQEFLRKYPQHRLIIQGADPTRPFKIAAHKAIHRDLRNWVARKHGKHGRKSFGYSYNTLKKLLTPSLGGTCRGGGGGVDEFKRVLRLMAEL
jgi:hypothetical protein